ncbi:MAG: hypothetical protein ACFBSG_09805 [Leptolyngbyaceae cyanobacterium]
MNPPDSDALRARNILLSLFVEFCLLDAILVFLSADIWAIGRLSFIIMVMFFVVRGRRWAKWVLITLLGLLVFALLSLFFLLGSELSLLLIAGSLLLIVLSISIIVFLLNSTALNRYFAIQRRRYRSLT